MNIDKTKPMNNYFKQILTVFTSVLPLSLSAAFFMGFNYAYSLGIAAFAALFSANSKSAKIMPAYAAFLIMIFAANSYGLETASLAAFVCGIISIVCYYLPKRFEIRHNPVISGVMLSTALTVTILLTTHYFGIGASGNNVREMIASYLSLGFHPNWRGVLYGTVVMVIMITFPRKFKKLCSIVKAPFIAIIVTLILNLFLNPSDFKTAITEIGNPTLNQEKINSILFFSGNEPHIFTAITCGIALFFVCNYALAENESDADTRKLGAIANLFFGTGFALIFPYGVKKKNEIIPGIGAAVLCVIILIFSPAFLNRIPVHSLAVVMIVGAWESVKWSEIRNAFSSPVSVICFIASAVSCLYFGFVYGILISAALYAFYHFYSEPKSKTAEISG